MAMFKPKLSAAEMPFIVIANGEQSTFVESQPLPPLSLVITTGSVTPVITKRSCHLIDLIDNQILIGLNGGSPSRYIPNGRIHLGRKVMRQSRDLPQPRLFRPY